MPRLGWFRLYAWAAIVLAVAATLWLVATRPPSYLEQVAFFTVLVAVASFFSAERDEISIGFEAAVVFPAVVLLHDPGVALASVFVGTLPYQVRARGWRGFVESAQLALAYFAVALLYTSAVDRNALTVAKLSGYVLLLVGYLGARVAVAAARRVFDIKQVVLLEFEVLLVITAAAAVEMASYQAYGKIGFALAFLPVLVIAFVVRRELRIEDRNAELMRRNRELSILTESATGMLISESEAETLRQMVALLGKLAKLKACTVVTWEQIPDGETTVYRFGECLPNDQEIVAWVNAARFSESVPSRAFVFQNDQRHFPLSPNPAIQVIIGIQTAEVIYGVLIYETEDPAILQSGSLNLLTLLVNQIGVSLQDQVLREEMAAKTTQLEIHAATMSTILELSTGLIGSVEIEESLTRVAKAIRDSLGFQLVIVATYDPERDEFIRRAHAGVDHVWEQMRKMPVPAHEITRFFDSEFRLSNSYFVPYTALQPAEAGVFVRSNTPQRPRQWHENDMLLVPLVGGEQVVGYISVREPRDATVPAMEQVRTLEIFAVQAVMALQSAQQYEEIKRLTFIDALTRAYNFRYFQDALAKEIHRHQRTGQQLALGMIDIDNFKMINDTFGHPVGDEILKGLVDELMRNKRDSDVVARYGGEEFAIIFPATPAASAKDAANRMRELIERREFEMPQLHRNLRVTASMGVAVFPTDGATATDLIARADAALYFAKKNGKNQVAMASELPAEGVGAAGA